MSVTLLYSRLVLPVTLMLVSAASMALEIVAGRALAPYVGMSLYSWTVIIAVVLAGLSIGHWLGGLIADRYTALRIWVAGTLAVATITTLASLGLLKVIEPAVSGSDPISHVAWLSMGAFFAPSALAGIISPVLTKIALDETEPNRHGRVLGLMFALGAFGAIVGTLLAGLVFISWIGTTGSVIVIAALYGLLSLAFFPVFFKAGTSVALVIVTGLAVYQPQRLGLGTSCLEETSYFCVRVDDVVFNGRQSRLMALDHLAHGINDAQDPEMLLSAYVQGVDEIVRTRFPEPGISAFFMGGGAYTLPRAWQSAYPEGRFTIAEIDPAVTRIADEEFWFDPGANTRILHGDARRILSELPRDETFDVIFGDAFHDITIPPHLVSDEFHTLVKSRLNDGGVYVVNVLERFGQPALLLSLVKTLQARFNTVELWLDLDSVPEVDARVTWIVLATDIPTPTGTFEAKNGFYRQWARAPIKRMGEIVGEDKLVFLTDDYAPVDRLLSGVLLDARLSE
ncbi:MAG: fused MFS/spermidine synthase [Pseudomonadota bacterium]